MARNKSAATITAAQPIRPYRWPQYLVETDGEHVDHEELAELNSVPYTVIERAISGWEPYNAIVRVEGLGLDYLVKMKSES